MRNFRRHSSRHGVTQFFGNFASLDLELFTLPSEADFLRDCQNMTNKILETVRLLLMDVDGVLTDGSIVYSGDGPQTMRFNVKDGLGIRMLQDAGVIVGIITGRKSAALSRRMRELGVAMCFDGVSDKGALLEQILIDTGLTAPAVAFIGDDLPDLSIMKRVGVPIAVADAEPDVKKSAAIVTARRGGNGAVREVCDAILQAKNLWSGVLKKWE